MSARYSNALFLALLLSMGASLGLSSVALAEDLFTGTAAVEAAELEKERALGANNDGSQIVGQVVFGGIAESGAISFGLETLDNQRMVINAFNTGSNVVMQNQLAVEVNMYDSMTSFNAAQ